MNQLGVFGLGTMGLNLALNIASKNLKVSVYNREQEVYETIKENKIDCLTEISDFVKSLQTPRIILLMVTAGSAVDSVMEQLIPHLNEGDIIIDGGNSYYKDSNLRHEKMKSKGMRFVSMGVSGGAKGALLGPSLMPSCDQETYAIVEPYLNKIAAKTKSGEICSKRLADNGAGHFVKSVHNGIEYAEMQLITDMYNIMYNLLSMPNDHIADIFTAWNQGLNQSYLLSITIKILNKTDHEGHYLLNKILDIAKQNGTGKWTIESALDLGVSAPTLYSALSSRIISEKKNLRVILQSVYNNKGNKIKPTDELIDNLKSAYSSSKIVIYQQGIEILNSAKKEMNWDYSLNEVISVWQAGCIIESSLVTTLSRLKEVQLTNLFVYSLFKDTIQNDLPNWRNVVSEIVRNGLYTPTLTDALSYFEGITHANSSANLIQAMRNLFGDHLYRNVNSDVLVNTDWNE